MAPNGCSPSTGFPLRAENPFATKLFFVVLIRGYRLKHQLHLGTLGAVG